MRLLNIECRKIIMHPFLWIVWAAFVLLQLFQIYGYVGNSYMREELQNMHAAVLDAGVSPEDAAHRTAGQNMKDDTGYREAYEEYKTAYGGMYDNLDMMRILERKQEMSNYYPKGKMKQFMIFHYQKLQNRVEQICATGEDSHGFYPGNLYKIHSVLYGHIWKNLILEAVVLMMLSVLYLMDYERINRTREIVIATAWGKGCMRVKLLAGVLCGIFYSLCLVGITLWCFFSCASFQGLWKVPVAACMVAEPRNQIMYPFVTFFRITERRYLLLSILVLVGCLLLVAGLAAALQYLLQNSYYSFTCMSILFMGLYMFAYVKTGTLLDLFKTLLNPAVLYITSGGWFMENSLELCFGGNEFVCLGACGIMVLLLISLGWWRYQHHDV